MPAPLAEMVEIVVRRIARKTVRRELTADDYAQLRAIRKRQLRAEIRDARRARKVAS